ncbi:MAG: hypothetical protein V4714_05125 [Bacteroidota bacterium]
MANSENAIFYPEMDGDVMPYYANLVAQLPAMAAKYGIDSAIYTALASYSAQMLEALNQAQATQQAAKASIATKNEVFAQAQAQMMRELTRLVSLPNFSETDAKILGIQRSKTALNLKMVKPVITSVTLRPDKVVLDWLKGTMDGVILSSAYDGITFTDLSTDLNSPSEDRRKNLTDKPETRYYRVRFLYKGEPVGWYSGVVKLLVEIY